MVALRPPRASFMFEIGWTELLVIAVVAIVVFPSKDLPRLLRNVGRMVGKARRMAGDFQSQFNAALREAEREVDLEDARKHITDLRDANPLTDVRKALDPLRTAADEIKRDLRSAAQPMSNPLPPVGAVAVANAPVKTGAAGDAASQVSGDPHPPEEPPAVAPPIVSIDVPAPAVMPPEGAPITPAATPSEGNSR
jgi:sec-independent protein translocase protein TatB